MILLVTRGISRSILSCMHANIHARITFFDVSITTQNSSNLICLHARSGQCLWYQLHSPVSLPVCMVVCLKLKGSSLFFFWKLINPQFHVG